MSLAVFDRYDRHILQLLQVEGRLSNAALAERVGLSPSPCLRRVKQLEAGGVVRGYQACLDREAVGLGLTVFVNVKVERHQEASADAFKEAIVSLPEVVSVHLVSGEADFLLQVVAPDLKHYERFLTGVLLKIPGVRDIRSNFAIQTLKSQGTLPI